MSNLAGEVTTGNAASSNASDLRGQPSPISDFTNLQIKADAALSTQADSAIVKEVKSHVSTSRVEAQDVTAEFRRACSGLETGQLVKDEWFTLFESVGALEIMDRKMDSGYLEEGESLDDEYDIQRELSLSDTLGIMDGLRCHEAAWNMGHPLSQTLFTSVYLDKLLWPSQKDLKDVRFSSMDTLGSADQENALLHVVLRAYCISLIKTCDMIYSMILSQYFHEEEDFVSHLYNRELLPWLSIEACEALLKEAERWLMESFKRKKGAKKNRTLRTRDALLSRLNFRRMFLRSLSWFLTDDVEKVHQSFLDCEILLSEIAETTELGTTVPESFSTKIQRRLASTVPPRPMVQLEFEKSMSFFTHLCKDGRDVLRNLKFETTTNLLNSIWHFMTRRPQPAIYIRASLQLILFEELPRRTGIMIKQLMFDELVEIVLPKSVFLHWFGDQVEIPSDPRFKISKTMERFVQDLAQPYVDLYRCFCQNRSRVRRTLAHSVDEWSIIEAEIQEYDKSLEHLYIELTHNLHDSKDWNRQIQNPLSSWATYQKLRQMTLFIQLGFELDVYATDELAGMYFYVTDLTNARAYQIEELRSSIIELSTSESSVESKMAIRRSVMFHHVESLKLEAQCAFANALAALYAVLMRLKLIKPLPRPYSTDTLRYDVRMKPFLVINEDIPSFDEYKTRVERKRQTDKDLVDLAAAQIRAAKEKYELLNKMGPDFSRTVLCFDEWKEDLNKTLRACVAAGIAVAMASKAIESGDVTKWKIEMPPPCGDDKLPQGIYHEWWIVPKFVPA